MDVKMDDEKTVERYSPVPTKYVLQFASGEEILIPYEGGIIGRTELGAELLADYPSVSREHMRVFPPGGNRVVIEDISSYGTFVDGKPLVKLVPTPVQEHSTVTLYDLDLTLIVKPV